MTTPYRLSEISIVGSRVRDGDVVGYPTEAVFGLGCDPFNESAVRRICDMKQRSLSQGLLLVAADFDQLSDLVDWARVPASNLRRVLDTWPGPHTWILPRSRTVPSWVSGDRDGIAVRVTSHLPATALCQAFGGAIISTSANPHGLPPARSAPELLDYFKDAVDAVLDEAVGGAQAPSTIVDALSGLVVRT